MACLTLTDDAPPALLPRAARGRTRTRRTGRPKMAYTACRQVSSDDNAGVCYSSLHLLLLILLAVDCHPAHMKTMQSE